MIYYLPSSTGSGFQAGQRVLPIAFFLAVVISQLYCSDVNLLAQDLDPGDPSQTTALEFGLSIDDVTARYGQPDRKELKAEQRSEAWHYGQTTIFFTEGQVGAWTANTGDLEQRYQRQTALKNREGGDAPYFKYGWKDAWQRDATISSDSVIDELFYPLTVEPMAK